MSNLHERLTECVELLHDEGFDRRESPIIDVIAARDEIERLHKLEAIVRRILSQVDDDPCWLDWGTLYPEMAALVGMPEWRPRVLDRETMLKNCRHFVDCLLSGERYETPSITEEEATKLRAELVAVKEAHAEEKAMADLLTEQLRDAQAKAGLPRPAAIVEVWDDETETTAWHAFDSVEAADRYTDESDGRQLYTIDEWTWHPKSSREHPAT